MMMVCIVDRSRRSSTTLIVLIRYSFYEDDYNVDRHTTRQADHSPKQMLQLLFFCSSKTYIILFHSDTNKQYSSIKLIIMPNDCCRFKKENLIPCGRVDWFCIWMCIHFFLSPLLQKNGFLVVERTVCSLMPAGRTSFLFFSLFH